jgi:outer membrane protein insertion porin family
LKTILRNLTFRAVACLFVLFVAVVAAPHAHAQSAKPPPKVGAITVKFLNQANLISEQVVRANMQLKEGLDFDPTMADRDIHTLMQTGHFELVDIKQTPRPDGSAVDLVVELTPKRRVQAVRYDGYVELKPVGMLSFGGFAKEIKTKVNDPLDEHQINEDATTIRTYYQDHGYNQATVAHHLEGDPASGFATVVFTINEGAKVKITGIAFTGNDHLKSAELVKQMETKKWWLFSFITGSGRLKDDQFDDDLDKLRDYYREHGYLDVDIPKRSQIGYAYPEPGKLVITIPVVEGRQYHLGKVAITGTNIIPVDRLFAALKVTSGMVFAPSKIDKDVAALEDAYGARGYIEARVRPIRQPNLETGNIDMEYAVTEGDQFHVESVKIDGNTKTKSLVILRELNLGPGDVFDSVRMKSSEQKLKNTAFFEEVIVQPQTTAIPDHKDLKISVKEASTGALNFGAGFSSLERLVVYAEVTQGNFDYANPKSLYQGAGQKARLRLELGTNSSEALLSWEEPWLFEQQLALGFQIYRTSANFPGQLYNEIRTGGQIYLRKHLWELIEGQIAYTDELVTIKDIDPTAGPLIQSLAGSQTVSKITLTFTRDTRDKLLNPTRGNRAELTTELAGHFGGDVDYYRIEARDAQFFPISTTQNQVFSLIGRLGVIDNYGSSTDVPYFDKFFLGGPYTLRGFQYRAVGPTDSLAEALGGKTYGLASAEYSIEMFDQARFALFYDAGFVNANAYDFSVSQFNDDFGFGFRLLLAGAPLNLDFGFPLTAGPFNRKGLQFNFSVGTRF